MNKLLLTLALGMISFGSMDLQATSFNKTLREHAMADQLIHEKFGDLSADFLAVRDDTATPLQDLQRNYCEIVITNHKEMAALERLVASGKLQDFKVNIATTEYQLGQLEKMAVFIVDNKNLFRKVETFGKLKTAVEAEVNKRLDFYRAQQLHLDEKEDFISEKE